MTTERTADKYLALNSQRHEPGMELSTSLGDPGIEVHSYPAQAHTQTGDIHGQQEQQWAHPQSAPLKPEETNASPTPGDGYRRILGLKVPVFWSLLIALVIVVAGAIGGGVGAGLHNRDNAAAPTAAPTSITGSGAAILLPLWYPDLVPWDDGCPKIDGQNYTPRSPATNGTGITLQGRTEAQTFQQHCNTDYAKLNGTINDGMYDLLSGFTKSFNECLKLCAEYSRQYQQHSIDENVEDKSVGYCRAVSMNKSRKLDQPLKRFRKSSIHGVGLYVR
ncbi:hypothetical protein PG985_008269 [Apiospora marii]|uniref:uncharacterized protein n=1 Tax=Apiospora marii TaxID=335849 RepID=UPI003130F977